MAADPVAQRIRVLICDDAEASRSAWNDLEALSARDGGPKLERFGPIATYAREGVERAARGAQLVLIDLALPIGFGERPHSGAGVWTVRAIARELRDARPTCVLWTANLDPCVASAFCALGGDYAIDKVTPFAEQVSLMRALVRDDRPAWQPPEPTVELDPLHMLLLPYLDANWRNTMILDDLRAKGGVGARLDADDLEQARTRMKKRLCPDDPRPLPTAITEAARAAGVTWIPLEYTFDDRDPFAAR